MRVKSFGFRALTSLVTSVTAFYLCGGPQAAHAAQLTKQRDAQRQKVVDALKLNPLMLDDPDAYRVQEAARIKLRRQAALQRARELVHADAAEAKANAARLAAAGLEKKAESQRLARKLAVATAEGKKGDALKTALEAQAPGFKAAKPMRAAKAPLELDDKKPMRAPPAKPRLKGASGALTPELEALYASVEGEGVSVLSDDGELRPVDELLYGYEAPRAPKLVAALASDMSFGLFGALPQPTADDLAETPETRRTPELMQIAQQAGPSALALYNLVHMNVAPELYFGSKKGAAATLREGAGNDFDQSSLLVALLRASGIPARYEHGVVRLTLEQALALTGADTLEHAAYRIGYTGAPTSIDGNTILTERIWVRAFVPYGDYKGTGAGGESLWVRLDPGMKQVSWKRSVSLRGLATFDVAAYLSAPNVRTPAEVFEAQLLAAAKAKSVCNNLEDALAAPRLIQPALSLLPSEHPAKVEASLLVFSSVPSALRWNVEIAMDDVTKQFTVAELQYRKLALRYVGASAGDEQLITDAGGIVNVTPFRVRVAGTLRLDGVEVRRFGAVQAGQAQTLTVRLFGPGVAPATLNHRVRAGGVYGIALYAGTADPAYADALKAQVSTSASDDNSEAAGHAAAALYASQQQRAANRIFGLEAHGVFQDVLEAVAGRELGVTEAFGIPVALSPGLYILDVGRDALTPVPMDGDSSRVATLGLLSGTHGSTLEARAWETVFANRAIAAVPVIQEANAQGIPVFDLSGGAATGLTGYSAATLTDVAEALSANWRVTIPQRPVTLPGYVNVEGYILYDPATGSGMYLIGHANGGGVTGPGGGGPGNCTCPDTTPAGSTANMANGRYVSSFTDLTLPAIGLPIVFSRTYASDFKQLTALGVGWLHSYGVFLKSEPNGDVTFVTADTTEVRFVKTGSTFAVPAGWYYSLSVMAGGYRVRAKDGYVLEFDSGGRLTRMLDTSSNAVTMVYTGPLLTSVLDSSGGTALTLSYTGNKLTSVTDRALRTVAFGYTGDDLTSATDVLSHTESYGYDARHLLSSRTDKRGKVWRVAFDAFGRWSGSVDPDGHETHAAYDNQHLTSVVFDKTGAMWRTAYDASGHPLEKVSPLGEVTKFTWVNQERTKAVDGRGFETVMTYDAKGNLLTRLLPDGRLETNTYEPNFSHPLTQASTGMPTVVNTYDTSGRLKTRNAGLGVTTYNYDVKGQLDNVVEPGPATTTFGHDAHGNVKSVTDATSRLTTMHFDAYGHLDSVTDGNNRTRTMEVDAAGRVKAQVDALNRRSEFTYDAEGHRLTAKDPENAMTTFGYDGEGRLTSVTDANGKVSRTEYDAEGRVTATVDARGNRSTRKYDAAGRLVETTDASGAVTSQLYCGDVPTPCAEVDALGNVTTREFDAVGRVTRVVDALGRENITRFDTAGRVSLEAGPGKPQTSYGYEPATGLLSTVTTPALTVSYLYDNRGNRRRVTAPGQQTNYTFDLANRLLTETNPLNETTTYAYDAAGNRRTKRDANGHVTTYSYDDNRRLTRVDFDDGTAYEYGFDTRGNRTLEKGPSHERQLHYDALNRLDVVDDITFGKQLTYGYDAVGNRTSLTEGGVTQRWEYDARNMLAAARVGTGPRTLFGYDAMGRRSFVARPNGVRTDYAYDGASQLSSMVHAKGGNVLLGFSYGYDGQGNRVSKTREDGTAEVYGYDTSMRLTQVDYGTARTVEYGLDALGNRTSEVETVRASSGAAVTTRWTSTFNAFNQLLTRNGSGGGLPALNTNFAYDDNGNTLSETAGTAVTSYTWDRDNRLRAVTPPAPGVPTSYSYDTNGFRVQRVDATGITRYLLAGPSVLAELDGVNGTVTRILNNPKSIDDMISFDRAGSNYFPLTDALGSVHAVTDSSGAVVRRYDFDVYGARSDLGGGGPSIDFGYTNRWHDANGLVEHRQRQRDPQRGQWLRADFAEMVDGPNVYLYVDNTPASATDPSGYFKVSPQYVKGRAPAYDSVTAYALNQPLAFLALIAALGMLSEALVVALAPQNPNNGCDDDDGPQPRWETFFRGDSLSRAETSVALGFTAAGVGTESKPPFGPGLYMSRDLWIAEAFAADAFSTWGSGAVLKITIATIVWKAILAMGAKDHVPLWTGTETWVPAGPPMQVFDQASSRVIIGSRKK